MRVWISAMSVLMLLLAGCSGKLTTHPATEDERNGHYDGIKFYPTSLLEEKSKTTTITTAGKIVARETGTPGTSSHCTPVELNRLFVGADFSRPLIMQYKPGLLEAYTFSPVLADGMLVSFSAISTPDQGKTIQNILTGIGAIATPFKADIDRQQIAGPAHVDLACTDGVVVTGRDVIVQK